jgi:hypothetical protein
MMSFDVAGWRLCRMQIASWHCTFLITCALLLSRVCVCIKEWKGNLRNGSYQQPSMTCFEDMSDDILYLILEHVSEHAPTEAIGR